MIPLWKSLIKLPLWKSPIKLPLWSYPCGATRWSYPLELPVELPVGHGALGPSVHIRRCITSVVRFQPRNHQKINLCQSFVYFFDF